jgi:hypothetical protein
LCPLEERRSGEERRRGYEMRRKEECRRRRGAPPARSSSARVSARDQGLTLVHFSA